MNLTDRAIAQFRKRLTSVIAAKGGHREQHFDQCFRYRRRVRPTEIFIMCVLL